MVEDVADPLWVVNQDSVELHPWLSRKETLNYPDLLEAWKGFFDSFPDYRNILESVTFKDDTVTLIGRSTCSDERLDGPAVWTAKMRANQVAEWRVYDHIVEPP